VTRIASAGLAVALAGLVWALLHLGWYPHGQIVDYPVYRDYGDRMVLHHAVPYRDFRLEYPPGALPIFALASRFAYGDFRPTFQILMLLCFLATVLVVLRVAGRRAAALTAIAPLLLGSVILSRFDLWPTLLAVAGIAALVLGSPVGAAVLLATSFAAKLWAAALVPLAVMWIWKRDGRRAALQWLGITALVAAVWFVPFAVASPSGVGHMFYEQLARPLQIESLGGSLLVALHHVAGTALAVPSSFGSQNVAGFGVGAVTFLTGVAEGATLVAIYWLFWRGEPTVDRLLLACAAATAALLVFGKVLSPQFLIWLIPLVPLARRLPVWGLFAIALVLTQVYFPRRYWDYVALNRPEVLLVLARNFALVGLLAALVYAIQGSTASSSERASSSVSARSGAQTSG
jgi:uncharacterized membrane protein